MLIKLNEREYKSDGVKVTIHPLQIQQWSVIYLASKPADLLDSYDNYEQKVKQDKLGVRHLFRYDIQLGLIDRETHNLIKNASPTLNDFIEAEVRVGAMVANYKTRFSSVHIPHFFRKDDKGLLALLHKGLENQEKYKTQREQTPWLLIQTKLLKRFGPYEHIGRLPEIINSTYL